MGLVLTREAAGAAVVSGSFESVAFFLSFCQRPSAVSWGSWSCDAYPTEGTMFKAAHGGQQMVC